MAATKLFILHHELLELCDTHRYFNKFVMSNRGPNPYRSKMFFQVSVQKSGSYLYVQHSQFSEQNLLQVTTCQQSKLDKIGHLGYQLKYMSNKKVCMTTEHNNFLTVVSREDALLYQTAANLLKDAISYSIPTICNNQYLLRLSHLVRMIEFVQLAKSIR